MKFGSLKENELKRLRDLEKEILRLNRFLAEQDVELDVGREFLKKSKQSFREAKGSGFFNQPQDLLDESLWKTQNQPIPPDICTQEDRPKAVWITDSDGR